MSRESFNPHGSALARLIPEEYGSTGQWDGTQDGENIASAYWPLALESLVPSAPDKGFAACLSAEPGAFTLSASPLDPRTWAALAAARMGRLQSGDGAEPKAALRFEPQALSVDDAGRMTVLPQIRLTNRQGTTVSTDWRSIAASVAFAAGLDGGESMASVGGAGALGGMVGCASRWAQARALSDLIDRDLIDTLFAILTLAGHPSRVDGDTHGRDFLHGAQTHAVLRRVFYARLGWFDALLAERPYVLGDAAGQADAHLFGLLLTFDIGYRAGFPAPDAAIVDYPHLWEYAKRMYRLDGLLEDRDRQAIGLAPFCDGTYAQPWGPPAFSETVASIRDAWDA